MDEMEALPDPRTDSDMSLERDSETSPQINVIPTVLRNTHCLCCGGRYSSDNRHESSTPLNKDLLDYIEKKKNRKPLPVNCESNLSLMRNELQTVGKSREFEAVSNSNLRQCEDEKRFQRKIEFYFRLWEEIEFRDYSNHGLD